MDDKQAKQFGTWLRHARERAGLSIRGLAAETGIDNGMLSRFETGQIKAPGPDKLARLAEALNVPLADIFAAADYVAPTELPSPDLYLRAKYRDLSARDLRKLEREVTDLLASYGVDPTGRPAEGEDETPPTTKHKKGGTP